jgi:hypothetical protein
VRGYTLQVTHGDQRTFAKGGKLSGNATGLVGDTAMMAWKVRKSLGQRKGGTPTSICKL